MDTQGTFGQARPTMDTLGPFGQARSTMYTVGPFGQARPTMDTLGPIIRVSFYGGRIRIYETIGPAMCHRRMDPARR